MKKDLVSVVLPTFNERGNICQLILSVIKNLEKEKINLEIVVVDDNSPDGTAREALKLAEKFPVKVIVRTGKKGLALSIKRGIEESSGKIIAIMDTDLNHQPQDLLRLLQALKGTKADLAIGSRYIKGGGMSFGSIPKLKYLYSKIFNVFVKSFLAIPTNESLSGFLAIRRDVLESLPVSEIFQGYGDYCIRLVFFTYKKGYKICEVPVVYGQRKWGESKTKLLKHSLAYLLTVLKLKFRGI